MGTSFSIGRSGIVAQKAAERICRFVAEAEDVELFDIHRMTITSDKGQRRVIMSATWKRQGGRKSVVTFMLMFHLDKILGDGDEISTDWRLSSDAQIIYSPSPMSDYSAFGLRFKDGQVGLPKEANPSFLQSYRKWLSTLS